MLRSLRERVSKGAQASLGSAFLRLGWIGFWLQVSIGALPLGLTVYAFAIGRQSGAATRSGLPLIEWLTTGSLLTMVFTAAWFFWFTRIARQISDQSRRPSQRAIQRSVWIGVTASMGGILFSMLVMVFEVAHLFIYFLRAPQAGVPVVQTTGGGPASWVSAADIASLLALVTTMLVEVFVLILGLWLLFRVVTPSAEFPHSHRGEPISAGGA